MPTCFVVMGFGKKTDFETGRVLDLDQSYQNLIKPAVEAVGLQCIRADEVQHSGVIDRPMYDLLLNADVVVADISTSNRNAIYELGIRHACRPYTTVIVAEEQMMKSPFFDLNHIVIRKYKHLGEDIGVSEAKRFTGELTTAIKSILAKAQPDPDSPLYTFMTDLTPPSLSKAAKQAIATAAQANAPGTGQAHSDMMHRVDDAQKNGDWLKARFLLEEIRDARKASASDPNDVSAEDPYILQRLALATYKSKHPTPADAFVAARDLLLLLDPKTSNDTETLGLWGSVHKRTWETTKDPTALDEAIRGYERGFYLRNDYYNGINYAYLLNVRAAQAANLGDAIADYVQARRVRQEVIPICEESLQEIEKEGADVKARVDQAFATKQDSTGLNSTRYWILATQAEAHVGLEDGLGDAVLEKALAAAPEQWMKQSTQEQVDKLKVLLTNSPLKKLPAGGTT
jgi:Tetratricopeptide Repeats-Sensor